MARQGQQNNKDGLVNNLSDRVEVIDNHATTNDVNASTATDDYDYYIDMGTEPPRFAQYRLARNRNRIALEGNITTRKHKDVWDTITQDELDYYLKAKLRESPEKKRY